MNADGMTSEAEFTKPCEIKRMPVFSDFALQSALRWKRNGLAIQFEIASIGGYFPAITIPLPRWP